MIDGHVDTEPWESAGLYDPKDPNAGERLALLTFLSERGATLEQMVDAHSRHMLPGLAGELLRRHDKPEVPVTEIAARSGTSVERVLRTMLAAGIPAEPDTEVPEYMEAFMRAFEAAAALMGEEAVLAFVRVLSASAMNIAEGAVALFFSELGPGTPREGRDEVSRARQSEESTMAFLAVPEILSQMVREQFDRAQSRAQTTRPWFDPSPFSGTPPNSQVPLPDSATEIAALGFVDLVGSTAWSQTVNLREQNLALTRFESAAWSSAVLAGGRVVKMIGDAVFFSAPDADAACRVAIDVCQAAADDPMLPPARGAVGVGPVTPREGDYFGPLVNLLARLVKVGEPGEVVVTQDSAGLLSPGLWSLKRLSPATLSGVDGVVDPFVVVPSSPSRAQQVS